MVLASANIYFCCCISIATEDRRENLVVRDINEMKPCPWPSGVRQTVKNKINAVMVLFR